MEGNSIGSARENIYQPRLNMQSPFENSRLNRRGGAVCSKKLRGEGGGRGQSPFLGEKRNRVRGLEIHERPTKKPAFQKSSRKKNGLAYFEGGPRTRRSPPSLSTIVAVVLIFPSSHR